MATHTVMDWASTAAMMQGYASIGAAAAAGFTALAAIKALGTWRRDVIGRREIEVAEASLTGAYRAVEVISAARSPNAFASEGTTRPRVEGETEDERRYRDSMFAPAERLNRDLDFWSALDVSRFRVRAFFGQAASAAVEDIMRVRVQVSNASLLLASPRNPSEHMQNRLEAMIWEGFEDPDQMQARLQAAIETLDRICGPVLTTSGPSATRSADTPPASARAAPGPAAGPPGSP